MMIRPAVLAAIKAGEVDLAFRRWDRPRVKVGTRMRTGVGVVEVTEVDRVSLGGLRAEDARRAGEASLAALKQSLDHHRERPVWRVGVRWAGADPREALREKVPESDEIAAVWVRLDRLDAASKGGPWTRATLEIIDAHPEVRAPDLAARLGRETQEWKADVRKLKELGLTDSLAIGYLLSPRGEAVLDDGTPRKRPPRPSGTPLPRAIGAPATRALRAEGVTSLELVADWREADLRALHGVGPIAVERLRDALAERGLAFRTS